MLHDSRGASASTSGGSAGRFMAVHHASLGSGMAWVARSPNRPVARQWSVLSNGENCVQSNGKFPVMSATVKGFSASLAGQLET